MSWLDSFANVFRREIKDICSSTQIVIFCFYMPVCWVLIIWGLLGEGVITRAPVAFIDHDNTPLSREVGRALSSVRGLGLESWQDTDGALKAMQSGKVYAVIFIPKGYTRDSLAGEGGTLSLWLNENRYAVAGVAQNGVANVAQALALEKTYSSALKTGMGQVNAKRLVSVIGSDFYIMGNSETSFLAFLGSTLIPSLIMISAMLGFLTAFLRELWHKSVNLWLKTADNRICVAVFGKLLPWFAMYCLVCLFYMALFAGEGGFNITGSLAAWFALFALCLADFAAVAVLMAAIAPTWRMAMVMGAGYSAPALPYTGFSMPLDSMGETVRIFGECLPLTWLIQGQAANWTLGASVADLRAPMTMMTVLFIIPLMLGIPLIGWSYGKKAKEEEISRHAA